MKAKKFGLNCQAKIFRSLIHVFTIGLCMVSIGTSSVYAVSVVHPKTNTGKQRTDLSLEQLLGFYIFPNRVAYIKFELQDDMLMARQVWDNRIYELVRIDDLHFESEGEGHKIEFLKDDAENITGAKILERVLLTKVDYDPTKEVSLTQKQLQQLEGTYEFEQDHELKLTITSKDNGLELVQQWDGKKHIFSPRSEEVFLNEDLSFPLTFLLKEGSVTQVICFAEDVWNKIK